MMPTSACTRMVRNSGPYKASSVLVPRPSSPGPLPMSDSDLAFAPLTVLGAKLRSGEVSSVELTKFFLDRLEKYGGRYNCVVTVTRDLALKEAARADAERKAGRDRGPLHGIPYGAKDLLAAKGYPTTWGCAPYKERVIDRDATVIK